MLVKSLVHEWLCWISMSHDLVVLQGVSVANAWGESPWSWREGHSWFHDTCTEWLVYLINMCIRICTVLITIHIITCTILHIFITCKLFYSLCDIDTYIHVLIDIWFWLIVFTIVLYLHVYKIHIYTIKPCIVYFMYFFNIKWFHLWCCFKV